ncbi:glycoside hydrolase family 74 protein [Morchella conica CCBAS932]|uniref:Glycoside hydrolase family 74 protein n=1 Tax=Morchella conica CCBAS932 TaxID=1392247 RepID=A0A3N4KZA8_9PEZI|nr:glycoside hydrolase family 74 protein [Morchella conica CCBAS932]
MYGGITVLVPVFSAVATLLASVPGANAAPASQCYNWKNVRIGGGGGFVPSIVFNPGEKGVAYARTDIGGAYKLNSDDTWTPLTDFATGTDWNKWYVDGLATDPVDTSRVYLLTGAYTNSWDPNNGAILASNDYGATFTTSTLPFKVGGNMPGRGMGERLAVDPNNGSILFMGARSGNGLYKSTDYGSTWTKVTSFPNPGTFIPDPTDTDGLNGDIIGISFVTFDSTSGSLGTATPRIFVGVAEKDSESVFVSNDGGSTWTAVAGQPTGYLPHKGVLSPKENVLYLTYTDGAGPYDGTAGYVYKYNISAESWTNISPENSTFGYGGIDIDLQKPGTVMVAALNEWWPDANMWRSTDSGATWSPIWDWSYPVLNRYFGYDISSAPWLQDPNSGEDYRKLVGWMIEGLSIDPFDSNHFLYGTGATVYGSKNLLGWDTAHNFTLQSLATGIEETSIQGLVAPPTGPKLISAVGDITGFVHNDLDVAPTIGFKNPYWATSLDLDYAGNKPYSIVRVGSDGSGETKQIAVSSDYGVTWTEHEGAPDYTNGGKVALSADGNTVLWRTGSGNVLVSTGANTTFSDVSSLQPSSVIAADKKNDTIFYGASGSSFYISLDSGATFAVASTYTSSTSNPVKIVANPLTSGDVWVSSDIGLFHSTDFGATFSAISTVTRGYQFALGAPPTTDGYPAIYLVGTVDGSVGVFRSDDTGVTWYKINDDAHGFGSPDSVPVAADQNTYGRVYLGTNGRGIFYGDASCTV